MFTPLIALFLVLPTAAAPAIVACAGSDEAYPFDRQSLAVGTAEALPYPSPSDVTIRPDGREAWLAGLGGSGVSVHDLLNGGVVARLPTGAGPSAVAFSGDGQLALVTCLDDQRIDVFDAPGHAFLRSLPLPGRPGHLALDPASGNFYVVEALGTRVFEVAPDASAVLREATLGIELGEAVVSLDGTRLYLTERDAGLPLVRTIDRAALTEVGTTAVCSDPRGIDLTLDGSRLAVGCFRASAVDLIDTASGAVIEVPLDPGSAPRDLDIDDAGGLVFVAGGTVPSGPSQRSPVYLLDLASSAVRGSFDVAGIETVAIAVQPQPGGGGCVLPLAEIASLLAVRAGNDVRVSWQGTAAATDGYNLWRVDDKTLIDDAHDPPGPLVTGVCTRHAQPTCDDPGAVQGAAGTECYYQARGVCGGTEGP